MTENPTVSLEMLEQHARHVRSQFGGERDIVGACDTMCIRLQDRLRFQENIPREAGTIQEQRIGPDGEENHYVCIIDPEYVDSVTGTVWVDMSLDQFCDANKEAGHVSVSLGPEETIESIRLMLPDDQRRDVYQKSTDWLEQRL